MAFSCLQRKRWRLTRRKGWEKAKAGKSKSWEKENGSLETKEPFAKH
jgi:hypothetical protein